MAFEFRADLHCHTSYSDGSDTPEELLRKASEKGLKGISITDHDTIDAYTPSLFSLAETLGIELLPGVELSTELEGRAIHVLGYGFDFVIRDFLVATQREREARNSAILKKLAERGIAITGEELSLEGEKSIGRPHIAALMVKKGVVSTAQEAFDLYLKEGACCYAAGFKCTPAEAVEAIHRARGKAVLAHPHFLRRDPVLQRLLALPLDGLECYYAHFSKEQKEPWRKIAEKRGWIATGGSDYHGAFKPHIELGASWVDEATFRRLF